MTDLPVDPADVEVLTVAEQINQEHQLALEAALSAIQHAINCGRLLNEQKLRCKRGEFQNWVKDNCCFSHDTANIYMRACRKNEMGLVFQSLKQMLETEKAAKQAKGTKFISQDLNQSIEDFAVPDGHSAADWAYMVSAGRLLRSIERALDDVDPTVVARGIVREKELRTIMRHAHHVKRLIVKLQDALPSMSSDKSKIEPEQEAHGKLHLDS